MSGETASSEVVAELTNDRREWIEFVHFFLGAHSYMLELGRVKRVVRNPSITQVPQSEPSIAGVANLGGIIPVIVDGRSLLDLPPRPPEADSILLLLDRDSAQPTGLLVDDIDGIDAPHVDHVVPPATLDEWELPLDRRWFRAVVCDPEADGQTGVFDLEMIVDEARTRS